MFSRTLGRTGLRVSEIGLGCWSYGGVSWGLVDDQDSIEAIRAALRCGINFVDTADSYGNGHSEEIVAKALAGAGHDAIVCTKAGILPDPTRQDFSPPYLVRAAEASLRRLGRERIDVYLLHNPDRATLERGDAYDAMERLRESGKIAHWGVSVRPAVSWRSPLSGASDDPVGDARRVIDDGRASVIEIVYNMLETDSAEVFDEAAAKGVAIIARVPLASGLLAGRFTATTTFPPGDFRRRWPREELEGDLQAVADIRRLPCMAGRDLAQAALRFAVSHPAVTVTIPGARNAAQAEHNAGASAPFTNEDVARITAIARARH